MVRQAHHERARPLNSERYGTSGVVSPRGRVLYTLSMTRTEFERLVREALADIPTEISTHVENVDLIVEEWATDEQLVGAGIPADELLMGLYEGIPLPDRYNYDMVLPDKITLFQRAIEQVCSSDEEVVEEIRMTVVHEIAHHFGIDDDRLDEMGV